MKAFSAYNVRKSLSFVNSTVQASSMPFGSTIMELIFSANLSRGTQLEEAKAASIVKWSCMNEVSYSHTWSRAFKGPESTLSHSRNSFYLISNI